jgi:hypothetical protein
MRLPIGTINTLMQHYDVQLCDTCGRYLHLAQEPAPAAPEVSPVVTEAKLAPKRRKRKAPAIATA